MNFSKLYSQCTLTAEIVNAFYTIFMQYTPFCINIALKQI